LEELVGISIGQLKGELNQFVVEVHIPADLPLLMVADDLIVKVFVNILENAARYCPAGSQIEITATAHDDGIAVRIADNGPGLPVGYEDRIFERFVRCTSAVADGDRGIGLGLAICRSIVELHDGRIRCRNRTGGGAEFEVVLPRVAEESAPDDVEAASSASG
jgi:two-component system sensor histidine kinase KdpD